MWFLVMYSNCLEWNVSEEQTIINLFAILLLKVHLYLILLYHDNINNDYIHGVKFATPDFQILTCCSKIAVAKLQVKNQADI